MTLQSQSQNVSQARIPLCDASLHISEQEISAMARVIENRHGVHAWSVAHSFMQEHLAIGDHLRARAWSRVAQYLFENTTHS